MEVVGLIGLIVGAVVGYFLILRPRNQTSKDFQSLQPDVRVMQARIDRSGQNYEIRLRLHNYGRTAAYGVMVTLDGWPDDIRVPFIYPFPDGHGVYFDYQISIPLEEVAPIPNTGVRLWIRYQDRWHYSYELSYPVYQQFGIRRQLEQPLVRRPQVGFFKMHKHVREMPRS
ncbi:hypothetical protein [Petrachloros mirabilis]